MKANEQELAMALRGGLRGRFRQSFQLLENAFEVLDDRMAHCVTPAEYETIRPLLQQIAEQMIYLQRLGDHAADAAVAPVLHQICAPRPMELLGQLRELAELFNEILLQENTGAKVTVEAPETLSVLLTMGDDTLLNGLLANLVSNSLAVDPSAVITLQCEPGQLTYRDNGSGLPPDAVALLKEGTWSERLLDQGGLGLPLVRAYAAAMGWTLAVEPEQGTCLRFSLPPCAMNLDEMMLESASKTPVRRDQRRQAVWREIHPVLPPKE